MATRVARQAASEARGTDRGAKTTKTARVAASGSASADKHKRVDDKLAKELDRVLKVTEPQPQQTEGSRHRDAPPTATKSAAKAGTTMRRRVASTLASRSTTASSSKTAPACSSTNVTKPTRARATPLAAQRPNAGSAKGKQVEHDTLAQLESTFPWTSTELDYAKRSQGAMATLNETLKSLSGAVNSGYKQGQPAPAGSEWTEKKVETAVRVCEIALRVMRAISAEGKLGGKAVEVDRANLGLSTKLVGLGMYARALQVLADGRNLLLERYSHQPEESVKPEASKATSISGALALETPNWQYLASLPAIDDTQTNDLVLSLLFQALTAAWSALLGLGIGTTDPRTLFSLPQTQASGSLSPFHLGLILPHSTTTPHFKTLYRHLVAYTTRDRHHWLHVRHLSMITLSHTITTDLPSSTTPRQFWAHCQKTLNSYVQLIKSSNDELNAVSDTLDALVLWVEEIVEKKAEQKAQWFGGKEWTDLMDFGINLARKSGNSEAIDKALSYMTAGTRIRSESPRSQPSKSASVTRGRGEDALAEVTTLIGGLTKQLLVLEKYRTRPTSLTAAAAESALKSTPIENISDCLISLEDGARTSEILGKVVRAVERLRRECTGLVGRPETHHPSSLVLSAQEWLNSSVNLVEDMLKAPIDVTSVAGHVMAGAIDTLCNLAKVSHSAQSCLAQYDRGRRLIALVKSSVSAADVADWTRCVAAGLHNAAVQEWTKDDFEGSLMLAQRSCEMGSDLWELVKEGKLNGEEWTHFQEGYHKRFYAIGLSSWKLGRKEAAVDAWFECLGHAPPSVHDKSEATQHATLATVFESISPLDSTIDRLVESILIEPLTVQGRVQALLAKLSDLPLTTRGLIIERHISLLADRAYRPEIAQTVLDMGDALLQIYTVEERPVQRSRVLVKVLAVIGQSGMAAEKYEAYVGMMEEINDQEHGGKGSLKEYHVLSLLHRALFAYHDASGSSRVLDLSRRGMSDLRLMLVPPTETKATPVQEEKIAKKPVGPAVGRTATRSLSGARQAAKTATKTPRVASETRKPTAKAAAKVGPRVSEAAPLPSFEDNGALASLLGTLASLLGVLGHVLAKVEALKLARAVLRGTEDHIGIYVYESARLATEYVKLGKHSRASIVFAQAFRTAEKVKKPVPPQAMAELHLRRSTFLALSDDLDGAETCYALAEKFEKEVPTVASATQLVRITHRRDLLERSALAHSAIAAMAKAKGDAPLCIQRLSSSFRLAGRVAEIVSRLAPQHASTPAPEELKVKTADPLKTDGIVDGASQPSADNLNTKITQVEFFAGKHLHGAQWAAAESLIDLTLTLVHCLAYRGSVKDAEYFLRVALGVATAVKSPVMVARINTRSAEIQARRREYETAFETLGETAIAFASENSGPDTVEVQRIRGDVFSKRDMAVEAGEMFDGAVRGVESLEAAFSATEALVPSPRKLRASLTASLSLMSSGKGQAQETVLPLALAHVLRQQAWLLREAGFPEDSEQILAQVRAIGSSTETIAEGLHLEGRIGMLDAFGHFKTDLWMSSLTESTIAMPMGNPAQRTRDRLSARRSIQHVLERAEKSFLDALGLASSTDKVEDVRIACLSLALLRAFQTSLGQGSSNLTSSAAAILASSPGITLHREIIESIECKLDPEGPDDRDWPIWDSKSAPLKEGKAVSSLGSSDSKNKRKEAAVAGSAQDAKAALDGPLRAYWESLKTKYSSNVLLQSHDVSSLPPDWVVISINVTEDRNTMFVSRHQASDEPLVFTLPLDRQGKREGEADEDLFTFETALGQLNDIIDQSNNSARSTKRITTSEGRAAWWEKRFELDKRMQELLASIEFCWLGAFKTILSPKVELPRPALEAFRTRLERIFTSAISATDVKKTAKVHLDDSLLRCFATLSSKCKDEEVEDLVYFILDIYQFYGVQVALGELDIDQLGVDVKGALSELEGVAYRAGTPDRPKDEHIFLALDKNAAGFPWESIPILRGRAVSRIPSLPFLLDQVALLKTRPKLVGPGCRAHVDTRRVFYILNPSGDLSRTQTCFEGWLDTMKVKGWKGIVGRSPTEDEMVGILENNDLVLYFGHGGAEQYIRSWKIRHLPQCANVMLWGCSSGLLKDQGDFDRNGTAWNYMVAGSPSFVGNLWDVTDRDIDKLSADVFKRLHLDAAHVPSAFTLPLVSGMSSAQAVALARETCKLKYLTGAAPVVYGLPTYYH